MLAIVALRCQLSAGAAFLEDFASERKALTLVFQLCVEVHSSSCTKQEVHYVVTWTKQLCALQKKLLASVKPKNIPPAVQGEHRGAEPVMCQCRRTQGGTGGSTASDWRSSQSRSARSMCANLPGFPT